jgi:hypothetical protein
MAIHFNHTILSAHDSKASAIFLAEMLNLPAPRRWGPFQMVVTENGANLDYMDTDGEITPQHYAFLISEAEFDEIFGRIRDRKLPYWADPGRRQLGEINHHDGGRGVYFEDPNGHHPPVRQRRMESMRPGRPPPRQVNTRAVRTRRCVLSFPQAGATSPMPPGLRMLERWPVTMSNSRT